MDLQVVDRVEEAQVSKWLRYLRHGSAGGGQGRGGTGE